MAMGALTVFAFTRYRVSAPTEYIVRTGLGIRDISIAKKAFQWPFQRVATLNLTPLTYGFTVSAMSHEKLSFNLPVNFTVGPRDEPEMLTKYARFVLAQNSDMLGNLVKGVIEGEARVLAASMSVEDIFKDRVEFKTRIVDCVDSELRKFGLTVWNANVKDLHDSEGSEYFQYLRRKAVEGAVNQAKIDVSEARMRGDIGEKTRLGTTRQEVARIEAETVDIENRRRADITLSSTTLRVKSAEAEQQAQLAEIQAKQAAALRQAELDFSLNQRLMSVRIEQLRTQELAKAQVDAEASVKRAQGVADAAVKEADATLYRAKTEAEGLRAKYEAIAAGLDRVRTSLGGEPSSVLQYMMIDRGVYTELAAANAQAVKGMQPKITVWNTSGDGGAAGGGTMKGIADVYRMLPPLVTTVAEQTGIKPPGWMLDMPATPPSSEPPAAVPSADAAVAEKAAPAAKVVPRPASIPRGVSAWPGLQAPPAKPAQELK